jgi:Fic family protein
MQYIEQLNNLYKFHNLKICNKYNNANFFIDNINYEKNKEAYDYLKMLYIKDIWLTETTPSINEGETQEIIINYIETGDLSCLSKIEQLTVININNTVTEYIKYDNEQNKISIELIHNIHKSLMKDLFSEQLVGIFRKSYVVANNSNMEYVNYKVIETKLNILIDFFNNTICDNKNEYILKSIIFFSEFLRIHPYKDGNGRTARILFNYMTHHLIACPVSICDSMKLRKQYIEVLEKRADSLIEYSSLSNLIHYIYNRIIKTHITFISTC